jgi:hypothetical protein
MKISRIKCKQPRWDCLRIYIIMEKPFLRCGKCGAVFHFSIKKNWLLRNVLFFLPIKLYFCAKCLKTRYLWVTDKQAHKYHRV